MNEKFMLENQATVYLIYALTELTGDDFQLVEHSDKPDVVIKNTRTNTYIGVEITYLFYDDHEAMLLLGRTDELQINKSISMRKYIHRLNELLQKKAIKSSDYKVYHQQALLVRVASPVFERQDFERFDRFIKIPDCNYDYIWLLFYNLENYKWGFIKTLKSPNNN